MIIQNNNNNNHYYYYNYYNYYYHHHIDLQPQKVWPNCAALYTSTALDCATNCFILKRRVCYAIQEKISQLLNEIVSL